MQVMASTAFLFRAAENVSYRKTANPEMRGDLVNQVIVLFQGSFALRRIYTSIWVEIR